MDGRLKFVVTLPESGDPLSFAEAAAKAGSDLLEIRDDISPPSTPVQELGSILPLLISRRTREELSDLWIENARYVDQEIALVRQELDIAAERQILSHHSSTRMSLLYATELWKANCESGQHIKHVEPWSRGCEGYLKNLREFLKLISKGVTVLPMGEGATDTRRVMAAGNKFHYCALNEKTASAPGQALLAEELRVLGGQKVSGSQLT